MSETLFFGTTFLFLGRAGAGWVEASLIRGLGAFCGFLEPFGPPGACWGLLGPPGALFWSWGLPGRCFGVFGSCVGASGVWGSLFLGFGASQGSGPPARFFWASRDLVLGRAGEGYF